MKHSSHQQKAVGERVHDRMAAARHVPEDAGWTYGAVMHLARTQVAEEVIEGELFAAAETVARTGQSPEELFGDSRAWAVAKVEEWREDGAEVFTEPSRWSLLDLLFFTPFFATWVAALLAVMDLLEGNWTVDYTVSRVLMPLILSFLTTTVCLVFHNLTVSRGFATAVAGAVLVGGALVFGAAAFFTQIPWPSRRGPCWWDLVVVGGCAVLTAVVCPWWIRQKSLRRDGRATARTAAPSGEQGPSRRVQEGRDPLDRSERDRAEEELDWAAAARRTMRARGDLSGQSIESAVGEAMIHAQEAGSTLREEFGSPQRYAMSLPGDQTLPVRREMWARALALALAVLALVLTWTTAEGAASGAVLPTVLWVLASALALVLVVRRLRRRTAQRRQHLDPLDRS